MASEKNQIAFSDSIQKMDVFGDGNERPLVIADRSVIYLPMLDKKHYVVFSGASIFQDGKGLPDDDSKMKNNDETGNIDLKEFMNLDKELLKTIKDGILKFTKVQTEETASAEAPVATASARESAATVPVTESTSTEATASAVPAASGTEATASTASGTEATASEKVKPVFKITNGKNKDSEDLFKGEWKENFEINIKENEDPVKAYLTKVYNDIKTFLDTNKTLLNNKHFDKKRELLGSDEKISVLVNAKYKKLQEDLKKAYYIFKVAGDFLDTQPFGGFDLPDVLADEYKTKKQFLDFLLKSFKNMKTDNVYGTEIGEGKITLTTSYLFKKTLSPINVIPETKGDDTEKNTVGTPLTDVGFHLPSSNKNNLFCEDSQNCEKKLKLQDRVQVENKPIDLGDSNLTESKYTPAKGTTSTEGTTSEKGTVSDLEKDLKEKLKDKYVLMSNFKIKKSRTGGPLMNTQIFKNESTEEVDGMMIIFDRTFESKIDKILLHQLIKSGNYKLLKGDNIPDKTKKNLVGTWYEQVTTGKNLNASKFKKRLTSIKRPSFLRRIGGSRKKNKRSRTRGTIKRRNVSRKRNLRRS